MVGGLTSRADLLPSSSNTNDDALAPALMTRFQRRAHDVDIARAVESVIAPTVRHIDESALDILALLQVRGRIDEIRAPELTRPLFLRSVHINRDDLACSPRSRTLNHTQTHTSRAKDSNIRALLDSAFTCRNGRRAVAGRDAAA